MRFKNWQSIQVFLEDYFGDKTKANRWGYTSQQALDGFTPIQMLHKEGGLERVNEVLEPLVKSVE